MRPHQDFTFGRPRGKLFLAPAPSLHFSPGGRGKCSSGELPAARASKPRKVSAWESPTSQQQRHPPERDRTAHPEGGPHDAHSIGGRSCAMALKRDLRRRSTFRFSRFSRRY
jgi:hypothetical protein